MISDAQLTEMLNHAKEVKHSEPDYAVKLCSDIISEDPDSVIAQSALFLTGWIYLQAERFGLAYHIYQRCAQLNPKVSAIWLNMATCLEDIDLDKAIKYAQKARHLDKKSSLPWANEGLMQMKRGYPDKCIKLCEKALELDPDNRQALHNIGLSKLMLKEWDGWQEWSDTLGVMGRTEMDYGLPNWDGEKGKILVYGEQGVGDEIMFASCIREIMHNHNIVIDTDKRLQSLFARTFDCPVYGTRFDDESPILNDHPDLEYQIAIGQLPAFFRANGEFPGQPYLRANPDQSVMYRKYFEVLPGKKIGIAWTGGTRRNGQDKRSMHIDDFIPLLNDIDNTYISLEYNPVDKSKMEQFNIKTFPKVTGKGQDIDELAAMIGELDMVVTCCTTVVYIAGALGIPCYVLVPSIPGYRYHLEGDFPWYDSVKLVRQEKGQAWIDVVKTVAELINAESNDRVRSKGDNSVSRLRSVDTKACQSPGEFYTPIPKEPNRVQEGA